MRSIAVVTLLTAAIAGVSTAQDNGKRKPIDTLLPGVERILFLGDSITYDGRYIAYFETQWRLHRPERPVEIIACGLPSETVSGLSEEGHAGGKFPRPTVHERLARVLKKTRPQLVFACYGMNDGIYLPLDEGRFGKFKDGITKLHDDVIAAGAKIIHLTPPVFDALPIKKRVAPAGEVTADRPFEGYDEVLDRYSAWLLSMREPGWRVIDLHGPMKEALAQERAKDPKFTFVPDGVHPNEAGQLLLGRTLIASLNPRIAATSDYGDIGNVKSVHARAFKLIHQRQRILTDAWLTDTGHLRPMPKELPLDEARHKAEQFDKQLRELVNAGRATK